MPHVLLYPRMRSSVLLQAKKKAKNENVPEPWIFALLRNGAAWSRIRDQNFIGVDAPIEIFLELEHFSRSDLSQTTGAERTKKYECLTDLLQILSLSWVFQSSFQSEALHFKLRIDICHQEKLLMPMEFSTVKINHFRRKECFRTADFEGL